MYSAVFFGWPTTSIRPSRCTSTPTWSIEVASTTSNGDVLAVGTFLPAFALRASRAWTASVVSKSGSNSSPSRSRVSADLRGRDPRGQLADVEVAEGGAVAAREARVLARVARPGSATSSAM